MGLTRKIIYSPLGCVQGEGGDTELGGGACRRLGQQTLGTAANSLFPVFDLYRRSPESGVLWYKSRQLTPTIWEGVRGSGLSRAPGGPRRQDLGPPQVLSIFIYTYTCIYIFMYVHIYVYVCIYIYMCMCIHVYIRISMSINLSICICVYRNLYIYMYMSTYVCICIYMIYKIVHIYMHVCIYI